MSQIVQLYGALQHYRTATLFDDFWSYDSGHVFTSLAADSGTSVAESDNGLGILLLTTGATDNNEAACRTTNEICLVTAGRPIVAEAALQWTEANTDDANVAFGLASATGANLLVDDGAGPKTSGNQFLIYKVDGETVWRCQSRNGSGVTTSTSTQASAGAGLIQRLTIEIHDYDASNVQSTFFVNGVQLLDSTTLKPIVHLTAIASSTEMHLATYVKAGGANSEVVFLDYMGFAQRGRTT